MAIPETQLATLNDAQVSVILKDYDVTGLTVEQQQELALALYSDMEQSKQGFIPRPQQLKINKDTRKFFDGLGNSYDEVQGVMLHRMMTRGWWMKKIKRPICSSLDCKTGKVSLDPVLFGIAKSVFPDLRGYDFALLEKMDTKEVEKILTRNCKGCPMDGWGTATGDDGEGRKGKACKEMRRIYLFQKDAILPVKISLPPTSVNIWDDYISARLTNKITDLTAEAILRLIPKESGGYTVAAVDPKLGPKLKPVDMLQFSKLRQQFVSVWEKEEVTADDYDGAADEGAPPAGDDEPY